MIVISIFPYLVEEDSNRGNDWISPPKTRDEVQKELCTAQSTKPFNNGIEIRGAENLVP